MAIEFVGAFRQGYSGSVLPYAFPIRSLAGGIAGTPAEGDLAIVAYTSSQISDVALDIQEAKIRFVGSTQGSFAGTTSAQTVSITGLSGGIASAPADGDLVIVAYGVGSTVNRDLQINTPGGGAAYTLIGTELTSSDTFDANLRVAYKFMGSTPDTQVELTATGGGTGNAADAGCYTVHVFRGVDSGTPIDVTTTTATGISSRAANPPSITPSTGGAIVYVVGSAACGTGGTNTAPQLSALQAVTQADTNDCNLASGFIPWISGAVDPIAFTGGGTTSSADSWCALSCALRPATASPTAYTLAGSELYANDTNDCNLRVGYRFLGANEDEVVLSGTGNAGSTGEAIVHVFRGVDAAVLDVAVQTATGINTKLANPPSVTPVTTGAFVYAVGAGGTDTAGSYASSDLTDFLVGASNGTNDAVMGSGYIEWSGSGAVNPAAFTGGGTDSTDDAWCALTMALRPASSGAFELDCQPGGFTLTGTQAGTLADRLANAEPGTFTVTGFAADLLRGFTLNAESGAFDITGVNTTLLSARILAADPGSFVVTGVEAGTLAQRLIDAQPGAFTLTGFVADLVYVAAEAQLNAEPGSFAFTGFDAALIVGRVIDAQPGGFTLSGIEAGTLADRNLEAAPGAFVFTGFTAGVFAARTIAANPGAYIITGAEAGLLAQRILDAQPGAFIVSGFEADLVPPSFAAYEINAEPGVYTLTGSAAWANLNLEQFPSDELIVIVNE